MKLYVATILSFSLLTAPIYAQESQPWSKDQELSYALGYRIGQSVQTKKTLEIDLLVKGIEDALSEKKPPLNEKKMTKILRNFQRQQIIEARNKIGKINREKGRVFLNENKKKPGVVTLESGLQYKVIRQGTGETPTATDEVVTHYHGTLINDKVFDSSHRRGQPATFRVNQVIAGWQEALQLMKEGAKWQLFIPGKLAYGKQGTRDGKIGPHETLIFEIELLSIKK